MSNAKQYKSGTIESILEDRLADLLEHATIDVEQFVPLVMADMQQDLHCNPNAAPDLLEACKAAAEMIKFDYDTRFEESTPPEFGALEAAIAKAQDNQ